MAKYEESLKREFINAITLYGILGNKMNGLSPHFLQWLSRNAAYAKSFSLKLFEFLDTTEDFEGFQDEMTEILQDKIYKANNPDIKYVELLRTDLIRIQKSQNKYKKGFGNVEGKNIAKKTLKPLVDGWLHRKGLDGKMENTWYVASRICGMACRRYDQGEDDGLAAVDILIGMGLIEEPQEVDEFDFSGMIRNSEKLGDFLKELFLNEDKYLDFLIRCKKILDVSKR